jgi:two-component system nitrogen regulation response regulator GlnG
MCGFDNILGVSQKIMEVKNRARTAAGVDVPILIEGETGTGKELLAVAIHQASPRCAKPFVPVNCAAIPDEIIESELFGYERGAFTGAVSRRGGKFEAADGGSLYLDEICELPKKVQAKILRAIQFGEIQRIGSDEVIRVNARIIVSTNRNLKKLIKRGEFRDDLYYRLNVVKLCLPPLRERKEDIPILIDHFVAKYSKIYCNDIKQIEPSVYNYLLSYNFPGNVRELENIIQNAVIYSCNGAITLENITRYFEHTETASQIKISITRNYHELKEIKKKVGEQVERVFIVNLLKKTGGCVSKAAEISKVHRVTLERIIARLGIDINNFKGR